MIATECIS